MEGRRVQDVARRAADELPGVTRERPFGPDWEVYKVVGKVFLLITEVPGEAIVVLKCDPEEGVALRQQHASITRGYHMNKRRWITLHAGSDITRNLVEELVRESYVLVRAGLPGFRRPVLPDNLR